MCLSFDIEKLPDINLFFNRINIEKTAAALSIIASYNNSLNVFLLCSL